MNNRLLPFLLFLVSSAGITNAQTTSYHNPLIDYWKVADKNHGAAAKTTSNASRLIAHMVAFSNGAVFVPEDSLTYSYSGTRGGDLIHRPLKYDQSFAYTYNNASSSYVNGDKYVQTFDANNNIATFNSQQWNTATSMWANYSNALYTYDGNNNMLTEVYQLWITASSSWGNYTNNIYTYDGNNNVLTYIVQDWDGTSAWYNSDQDVYTYTATNKQATHIIQNWNSATSAWNNRYKYISTYDASDNLATQVMQQWNSGSSSWVNYQQTLYTYDASNNLITDIIQQWLPTSTWRNSSKTNYSNFAGPNPQTVEQQNWDTTAGAFVNARKYTYTYNSYGQELTLTEQSWNPGGFYQTTTNDLFERAYYEEFTTGVKNITATNGAANIFPVPATNTLHIDLDWNNAQAFTIEVCDVLGHCVSKTAQPATAHYSGSISTGELAAGTYVLKVNGTNGQVIRQFVVTH